MQHTLLRILAAVFALLSIGQVWAQANTWVNIHPSGPDNALGGPVNFIAYGPDGTAFLGSRENKLYRRATANDSWELVVTTLNGDPVTPNNFYFDAANPQRIVANQTNTTVSSDGSVIESLDSGSNWTVLRDVSVSSATFLKGQLPGNPSELFAYMPPYSLNNTPKLARSPDGGFSWVETTMPESFYFSDFRISSMDSSKVYALEGSEFRFGESSDGGVTWQFDSIDVDGQVSPWLLTAFDLSASNPDIIYGGLANQTKIARSVDGAESWQNVSGFFESTGSVETLAIDPASSDRVYFGTSRGGAYATLDGGDSWDRTDSVASGSWQHIEVSPTGEVLYAGLSGAAIYDENGNLVPSNAGYNDFPMFQLKFAPGDPDYLYATSTDVGLAVKLPGSDNWVLRNGDSLLNSDSPASFSIDFNNPARIVGYAFGVYLSNDAGETWSEIGDFPSVSGVWFDPTNSQRIFALVNSNFIQTLDDGVTWATIANDVSIQDLFISNADSNLMLSYYFGVGLRSSRDGGLTWQAVDESFDGVYQSTFPTEIAKDPENPNVLYFTFNELGNFTTSAVWRSDDFGLTWSRFGGVDPGIGEPVSIAADPFISERVYVLDFGGTAKVYEPLTGDWHDLGIVVDEQCGFGKCSIVPDPEHHGRVLVQYQGVLHEIQRDLDLDGILDSVDNCTYVANADQRDTDGDLYGNVCDADLNNDGTVNFVDLSEFANAFLSAEPNADFNGDGAVNFLDLPLIQASFLESPGPNASGD